MLGAHVDVCVERSVSKRVYMTRTLTYISSLTHYFYSYTLTLTLVLTTGLITIFILVISVIGKWSVICARAIHTDKHQNPYLQMLGSKVC